MSIISRKPFGPNIADLLISCVVIVVSLGCVWLLYHQNSEGKRRAMIYQDGKLVGEYDLNEKQKLQFEIKNSSIAVANGKIRIEKNDCPRGICQHSGWISRPQETIVCVPKKMLIEVVGPEKQQSFNAVSY